ncbi:hypothetical protein ACQPZF_17040 [Actinosynnema sp. CS-041913]|uniref:hypothetical protein n=1 Tax=Actinosynnema sp. CS-041913 TaxID=3239917 RepID=UPI003D9120C4
MHGPVVQAGVIRGDVVFAPLARSGYLHQVSRIAPAALLDRNAELAELAAWCAEPEPSYLWWRAPAWSGKTALLSWFTLHPPAGVDVVSFFVTSRLAGQADRVAFSEVVLEQCAAMVGEPLPTLLTDATRDGHVLAGLASAAEASARCGRRLVLVVDGLDEDRGAGAFPDAHSIASLLPSSGVRVVVSSRTEPPIPPDVPDAHPLRGLAPRSLSRSLHAQVVRVDARRELVRLLRGTVIERDLLGFVTVAGGVGVADLAELCETDGWVVEEHLGAVSARSFTRRDAGRAKRAGYLLGHEELQREAELLFGPQELTGYRRRLHRWAAGYRNRSWPSNTPDYLVENYFDLLRATGDIDLVVPFAADPARHALLRRRTGGNGAALREIDAARSLLAAQPALDWLEHVRLAIRESDLLIDLVPLNADLAMTWARLEQLGRAEDAARSLPSPYARAQALASLAALVPDVEWASTLGVEAERLARSKLSPPELAESLARLALEAAVHGHQPRADALAEEADRLARATSDVPVLPRVLAHVAGAMSAAGHTALGSSLVYEATGLLAGWGSALAPRELADLALTLVNVGHLDGARAAVAEAEGRARNLYADHTETALTYFVEAVPALIRAATAIGDPGKAFRLGDEAAAAITEGNLDEALYQPTRVALIYARATIDGFDDAVAAIRSLSQGRAEALSELAALTAVAGDFARAHVLATEAERLLVKSDWRGRGPSVRGALEAAVRQLAGKPHAKRTGRSGANRTATPPRADRGVHRQPDRRIDRTRAPLGERERTDLVESAAAAGDIDRAVDLALPLTNRFRRAEALVALVGALCRAGKVHQAEELIPLIDSAYRRAQATNAFVAGLASIGAVDKADAVVESIADLDDRVGALCAWARIAIAAGDPTRAAWLVARAEGLVRRGMDGTAALVEMTSLLLSMGHLDRAEAIARSIRASHARDRAVTDVVRTLTETGAVDRAHAAIHALSSPRLRATALADLAAVLTITGDISLVDALATDAVDVVKDSGPRTEWHDPLMTRLVGLLLTGGRPAQAEMVARAIVAGEARGNALACVATQVGKSDATRLLGEVLSMRHWPAIMTILSIVQPDAIATLARELLPPASTT